MKRTNSNLDERIKKLHQEEIDTLMVAIVVSEFNSSITEQLRMGAISLLEELSLDDQYEMVSVPGSFEIPLAAQKLAQSGEFDAIVCLGCVIQGETPHFDYICQQVSRGVGEVGLEYGLPVTFGVITADTREQAEERADTKLGNKGADAVLCAVEMAILMERLTGNG
jgi:6,7-dimethyl-8-ribityllumazine synthase